MTVPVNLANRLWQVIHCQGQGCSRCHGNIHGWCESKGDRPNSDFIHIRKHLIDIRTGYVHRQRCSLRCERCSGPGHHWVCRWLGMLFPHPLLQSLSLFKRLARDFFSCHSTDHCRLPGSKDVPQVHDPRATKDERKCVARVYIQWQDNKFESACQSIYEFPYADHTSSYETRRCYKTAVRKKFFLEHIIQTLMHSSFVTHEAYPDEDFLKHHVALRAVDTS